MTAILFEALGEDNARLFDDRGEPLPASFFYVSGRNGEALCSACRS